MSEVARPVFQRVLLYVLAIGLRIVGKVFCVVQAQILVDAGLPETRRGGELWSLSDALDFQSSHPIGHSFVDGFSKSFARQK